MFPLRFFFVLAGAARSSLLFRIADRPLFWGIIFGLVSGLWELGLPLGIIFELLWLDVLPLGSVVPPYGTLSFLLLFPIAELYDWRQPDMLLLPIVFAMLCAYMAAWLEQYQREVMDDASERVQCWCTAAAGGMRPGRAILSRECCRKAYLRGAFLACGWISQPEKAYHFEFAAPDEEQAKTLQELIARWDVQARISARKSQQIVYVKKSEDVETLLGVLGASSALLTFENVRIMKGLRNDLNRQMICDDFNTDKTVRAAAQQLDDIAVIEKYLGLGKLPASLRQAAEARIASPDATLSQLGELMDPPAAKSAVNKRIRRLGELAQKLRDEHGL